MSYRQSIISTPTLDLRIEAGCIPFYKRINKDCGSKTCLVNGGVCRDLTLIISCSNFRSIVSTVDNV